MTFLLTRLPRLSPMKRRGAIALVALALVASGAAVLFAVAPGLSTVPIVGRLIGGAGDRTLWVCPMHPEVVSHEPGTCPICGMDLVQKQPASEAVTARAAATHEGRAGARVTTSPAAASVPADSPEPRVAVSLDGRRQQLINVRLATAARTTIAPSVRASGIVRYDETRLADVNLKIEGWIRDLRVNTTGEFVKKGQPLFTIYSPELVATQTEYLLALKTRDQLRASQVADAREYSERLVEAARQRLLLWDLPADQLEALERSRTPNAAVAFRSPVSGYVIEKRAVQGMRVMPGESLFRVADLSTVWVEADVFERELSWVRTGTSALVTLEALPGETLRGRVSYIYPYLSDETRSARVRVELPNPRGRLKPGMYAAVELSAPASQGITVPTDAVIDAGRAQFVFVALGDGYFEPRRVRLGKRLGDRIEILEGVREGDQVASGATFFIDSESQLRAAMQGFAPGESAAGGAAAPSSSGPAISMQTSPDPPRNGDNEFVVTVRNADGTPIDGLEVSLLLYMAPMPSMNMPAMRSEASLVGVGGGVYRGRVTVSMAGRWDVTVTARRGGERVASRQIGINAR